MFHGQSECKEIERQKEERGGRNGREGGREGVETEGVKEKAKGGILFLSLVREKYASFCAGKLVISWSEMWSSVSLNRTFHNIVDPPGYNHSFLYE